MPTPAPALPPAPPPQPSSQMTRGTLPHLAVSSSSRRWAFPRNPDLSADSQISWTTHTKAAFLHVHGSSPPFPPLSPPAPLGNYLPCHLRAALSPILCHALYGLCQDSNITSNLAGRRSCSLSILSFIEQRFAALFPLLRVLRLGDQSGDHQECRNGDGSGHMRQAELRARDSISCARHVFSLPFLSGPIADWLPAERAVAAAHPSRLHLFAVG